MYTDPAYLKTVTVLVAQCGLFLVLSNGFSLFPDLPASGSHLVL